MKLTLSVDAAVVARARKSAAALGLSLNQAVRNYLSDLAGRSPREVVFAEVLVCQIKRKVTGRVGNSTVSRFMSARSFLDTDVEDIQHGFRVNGLQIRNPFAETA